MHHPPGQNTYVVTVLNERTIPNGDFACELVELSDVCLKLS